MPLSASVLGPLLQSNIDALSDDDKRNRAAVFEAMAAAIITHITSAGLVTLTAAVATGVTAGGAAVPVTGIGVIS